MSSIDSVASSSAGNIMASQASFKNRRADFKALTTALDNNDLAGAQKAFAQMQKDDPKLANLLKNQGASQTDGGSGPASTLQSLATSLNNGDISGAQKAIASLKQGMQSGRAHHHHHHVEQSSESETTNSTKETVGNVINTSA